MNLEINHLFYFIIFMLLLGKRLIHLILKISSLIRINFLLFLFFIVLINLNYAEEQSIIFSDTNYTLPYFIPDKPWSLVNYNRFRTDYLYLNEKWKFKTIFDYENFAGWSLNNFAYIDASKENADLPFNPYWQIYNTDHLKGRMYLYRIYGEYQDENNTATLGLQRVFMGVGRLWTPIDVYNPVNALSVEKDERLGIFGLNYHYYLDDLSFIQVIGNLNNNYALDKYGAVYKNMLLGVDTGLVYISSPEFRMAGIEMESNLLTTGVEVRTEITYFNDHKLNRNYLKAIIGADYAFGNNYTILGEYFYNGIGADNLIYYNTNILSNINWNLARHYLGLTLSKLLDPLNNLTFSNIYNIVDGSIFWGLALDTNIAENMNLTTGLQLFTGSNKSEFGQYNTYGYLRLVYYFN